MCQTLLSNLRVVKCLYLYLKKGKRMQDNHNVILKTYREKKARPTKWQMGLTESQELFKDKRHLKENRTTNNHKETGK